MTGTTLLAALLLLAHSAGRRLPLGAHTRDGVRAWQDRWIPGRFPMAISPLPAPALAVDRGLGGAGDGGLIREPAQLPG
jgi:hypothetical protein